MPAGQDPPLQPNCSQSLTGARSSGLALLIIKTSGPSLFASTYGTLCGRSGLSRSWICPTRGELSSTAKASTPTTNSNPRNIREPPGDAVLRPGQTGQQLVLCLSDGPSLRGLVQGPGWRGRHICMKLHNDCNPVAAEALGLLPDLHRDLAPWKQRPWCDRSYKR